MSVSKAPNASEKGRFAAFVETLTQMVDEGIETEAGFLERARVPLERLVSTDDWLADAYAAPHEQDGMQYLLYRDPRDRFSVVSVVWGPGQTTPIHDHKVWGLVGVLRGSEIEERYELLGGKPVLQEEERLTPGQVCLLSPTAGDVHRVRNAFDDRDTISIHVYGGDIGSIERHSFQPDGRVETFKTGYANDIPAFS